MHGRHFDMIPDPERDCLDQRLRPRCAGKVSRIWDAVICTGGIPKGGQFGCQWQALPLNGGDVINLIGRRIDPGGQIKPFFGRNAVFACSSINSATMIDGRGRPG